MRYLFAIVVAALLAFPAVSKGEEIHAAAAISLKESMETIAASFKEKTGNTVQFNFGSSGAMLAQIKNGAETDVFLSAANKQMDDLAAAKLIDVPTRRVVATNGLVLIVPADAKVVPADLKALLDSAYHRIALGEPTTVPAGQYARESLEHEHLFEPLKDRLIYGANVRQVLVYVERGEADAGLVYTTDVKASGEKVKVAATVDPAAHSPIDYPAAVITASTHKAVALEFLDFLATADAQKILTDAGFTTPKAPDGR